MRTRWLPLLVALSSACEPPAPPAPPPAEIPLPPGRVRVEVSPAERGHFGDPDVLHGIRGRIRYAGRKRRLDLGVEYWEKGRRVFSPPWSERPVEVPLEGAIAAGVGAKKSASGPSLLYLKRVFPKNREEGAAYPGPLLDPSKDWKVRTPPPREVDDSAELLVGALVAEELDVPLEEIGPRAAAAWIFKLRLGDAPN